MHWEPFSSRDGMFHVSHLALWERARLFGRSHVGVERAGPLITSASPSKIHRADAMRNGHRFVVSAKRVLPSWCSRPKSLRGRVLQERP